MIFDLILKNNASKETFVISHLVNDSANPLYIHFEDVELPDGANDGEYQYALFINDRNDVTYEFKTNLLDTLIKTNDGNVELKYLAPITGIMRVGEVKEKNVYKKENNKTFYYKNKDE